MWSKTSLVLADYLAAKCSILFTNQLLTHFDAFADTDGLYSLKWCYALTKGHTAVTIETTSKVVAIQYICYRLVI